MRTAETPLYVNLWNALGASTVTSAWSEAYTLLQQGVADAVEADVTGLVNQNLQEQGKYLSKNRSFRRKSTVYLSNEDKVEFHTGGFTGHNIGMCSGEPGKPVVQPSGFG